MPRLRRSSCAAPGIARRRRGRGFEYRDPAGARIDDPEALARISELAIPPAWREVWICMDPRGHLQATGIDAAGRTQYLYHEQWRAHRDRQKFDSMIAFGQALPRLRRRVARDLRERAERKDGRSAQAG
ncbi:MAG: topoisomerase, partial [Solirubrobacteraceae bacterium]|nr:topoisomerase [Solirubrobacteraceae bacterium]